jgi:hypothetical protein
MFSSMRKGVSQGASTRYAAQIFSRFFALFLVMGAVLFAGCPMDDGDGDDDDHKLNTGLIGTWKASGSYEYEGATYDWTDTYIITADNIISHPEAYPPYANASIGYVYNFSDTAGCLIIQTAGASFTAVYFKNLSATTVVLGDAFNVADSSQPVAEATLEEAKERFKHENASRRGGGAAQAGSPQTKQ